MQVRSPASLSGLKIQRCRELRCRSQTRFGSGVAVAVAVAVAVDGSCRSNLIPSLGNFHMPKVRPQKAKKKKSIELKVAEQQWRRNLGHW